MDDRTKEELLEELRKKELEIQTLKEQLKNQNKKTAEDVEVFTLKALPCHSLPRTNAELNNKGIARYSRQLILPELGPKGQKKLLGSSVLIVGCGGLGCPAAIYLAAAGVGRIGLLDYDVIEISNLHRQVLHTEERIGVPKAISIAQSINALNKDVEVLPYDFVLTSEVALQLISKYDLILDCTDNVATRYLLNDACVMADKPLVSGSALRYEGQLTVYHYEGGPCYRCLHPKPPPPETVTNCSDGGVLGAVPGTIGCLQALEAIKIITNIGSPLSQSLLLFDGLYGTFRTVKLRGHKSTCEVCGDNPTITKLIDYEQFCGAAATDKDTGLSLLGREKRITVEEYKSLRDSKTPHVLIDTRLPVEQEICGLPNSVNIPMSQIEKEKSQDIIQSNLESHGTKKVFCICRRGNDSQKAVLELSQLLGEEYEVKDIIGGLTAWANKIDSSYPVY
ncbi:adenylyltransferase and sulfurtransferase MOCS3-like isoform X2 [Penaeus chinensis]|nr:adenylyltransferase and sulfurtransferase MOCS3-like isoform X2 [Penaeus chinensis]XP_047484078.1 adenylyltransferase and sulfurtransferase MOCS3-like isoform X2 [Penaeus chinensis]